MLDDLGSCSRGVGTEGFGVGYGGGVWETLRRDGDGRTSGRRVFEEDLLYHWSTRIEDAWLLASFGKIKNEGNGAKSRRHQ